MPAEAPFFPLMPIVRKVLKPVRHRDEYTRAVERRVMDYFEEVIFLPLFQMLEDAGAPDDGRENAAVNAVVAALKAGRVWYADGEFAGQFNAEISRELRQMGATFSAERGTFHLDASRLPFEIRGAAEQSLERSRALHKALDERLALMQEHALGLSVGLELGEVIDTVVTDLNRQFNDSVAGIETIEVVPEVTPEIAAALRRDLTDNLDLSIQNFTQQEIVQLRAEAAANAFAGYRSDRLADIIRQKYGVTKRKAAFLADQETGLLVSKYREQQQRAAGIRNYIWSTSNDERVRPDHRALDGQKFSWDSKPVTNRANGDRNHPGEDFRCRCVALAVIEMPLGVVAE